MSKTRYRWWGYVKAMIRHYPAARLRNCQGTELKERGAVARALEMTAMTTDAPDRIRLLDMALLGQTHTLSGAALAVPCSYATAKRWHNDFIRLVATCYGFDL